MRRDDGTPSDRADVEEELRARFAEAYDESGVDRSLIRLYLGLTPTERLLALENQLNALATVRRLAAPR